MEDPEADDVRPAGPQPSMKLFRRFVIGGGGGAGAAGAGAGGTTRLSSKRRESRSFSALCSFFSFSLTFSLSLSLSFSLSRLSSLSRSRDFSLSRTRLRSSRSSLRSFLLEERESLGRSDIDPDNPLVALVENGGGALFSALN